MLMRMVREGWRWIALALLGLSGVTPPVRAQPASSMSTMDAAADPEVEPVRVRLRFRDFGAEFDRNVAGTAAEPSRAAVAACARELPLTRVRTLRFEVAIAASGRLEVTFTDDDLPEVRRCVENALRAVPFPERPTPARGTVEVRLARAESDDPDRVRQRGVLALLSSTGRGSGVVTNVLSASGPSVGGLNVVGGVSVARASGGTGLVAARRSRTQARLVDVQTRGQLSRASVARRIRARLGFVAGVCTRSLSRGANGRIEWRGRIDPEGRVVELRRVGLAGFGAGVATCLENQARRWRFHRADHATEIEFALELETPPLASPRTSSP